MPAPFALPRARRLRRSSDFTRVERQGVRASGAFVVLVLRRGRGRVGFTVSKKVGNAVARNHVKRRLRDVLRRHRPLWEGLDVVVIAKPESAGQSLAVLEGDVLPALRAAQEKLVSIQAPTAGRRGPHAKAPR